MPRQVRNCRKRVNEKVVTYSRLIDDALAELVKIDEELLDADAIAGSHGLNAALNVVVVGENGSGTLEAGRVPVSALRHDLGCV